MQAINSSAINSSPVFSSIYTWGEYSFDGFNLNDKVNITMKNGNFDDIQDVEISSFDFAYSHGWAVNSRYFRGRDIHITGSIKAETPEAFTAYMDSLKKALSKKEKFLYVKWRKIRATLSKMSYNRESYNITWSPIDIVFKTAEAFWSKGWERKSFTGITSNLIDEISYEWTAPSSPIWYMVFQSGTSTTETKILHNGLYLTIPVSFTAWDVLKVDWVKKIVLKNYEEIDFTGEFPEFTEYSNPFSVEFTGGVNADVTVIFDKYFL